MTRARQSLVVAIVLCLTGAGAIAGFALSAGGFGEAAGTAPATSAPARAAASASSVAPSATPGSGGPPSPGPATTARPAVVSPPLPALLGAIGDSISQAFDAGSLFDNPSHSWVVGSDPNDGVFSIAERLRALGGNPLVVDAARSGARMADGPGQATAILRQAAALRSPATAFVTIELGGNDVCRPSLAAMATPAAFEQRLRSTIGVLRDGAGSGATRLAGLPRGSRILVMSVPDAARLRQLTLGVPSAQDVYTAFGVCRTFLGPNLSAADLAAAEERSLALNGVIARVCGQVEAADGATGRLHCRTDQTLGAGRSLYTSDFSLADVSTIDYFHPSLEGQAKIAAGAWAAGYWAGVPLPPVPSSSVVPGSAPGQPSAPAAAGSPAPS